MPVLLLPAGLAALAALLLPLAVHLARRSEAVPTDFAALRWLRERPRPRSRLRFDELVLLLVRLLLLALLAMVLARLALEGSADRTPVVAVVPGITDVAGRDPAKLRALWLAPGFPSLDRPMPAAPGDIASLVRQLDAELPPGVALTVVVPAVLQGMDAERPRLSRPVAWRVGGGAMPALPPPPATAMALVIRHAAGDDPGLRYLRAAAVAWGRPGAPAPLDIDVAATPIRGRQLAWLVPGPLPAAVRDWIAAGGTALVGPGTPPAAGGVVIWRDGLGAPLAIAAPFGRGRLVRLTRPLAPAVFPELLDAAFPVRLRALFEPPPPAPARVAAADIAPLSGAPAPPQPARELHDALALAIAGLWLAERWLATRRRRRPAP